MELMTLEAFNDWDSRRREGGVRTPAHRHVTASRQSARDGEAASQFNLQRPAQPRITMVAVANHSTNLQCLNHGYRNHRFPIKPGGNPPPPAYS